MFEWFNSLSPENKIQVISIISTSLISIISVGIALSSIIQSSRITKEANRPYLVFTHNFIQITDGRTHYIVLKNYGKTVAKIKSISTSREVDFCCGLNPFTNLINSTVSPGQSYTTAVLFKSKEPITFEIEYSFARSNYIDSFTIYPDSTKSFLTLQNSSSHYSNLEKIIINSTEELIKSKF